MDLQLVAGELNARRRKTLGWDNQPDAGVDLIGDELDRGGLWVVRHAKR
ncbi:hypothetical protein IWX65_003208 [Arthrobacter sp. CAN_A214]